MANYTKLHKLVANWLTSRPTARCPTLVCRAVQSDADSPDSQDPLLIRAARYINQSPPFIMRLGGIHRSAPTTWRQNNEIHVHLRPHQPIISEVACNHLGVRISRPVVHNAQSGGRGGVPSSQSGPPSTPEQPGAALVRRPSLAPVVQPVAIGMTQVVGKQVITRSTGRDLGVISCMWVDPNRGEVVSLDLEDKKSGGLASSCPQ